MIKYDLRIRNVDEVNMSNWQITHTVNTMTTINNKFDILNKLNQIIKDGCSRECIFILDRSYVFSTNYTTYFSEKALTDEMVQIHIDKLYNMGRLVTMEQNKEVMEINILFDSFQKISAILNKYVKCRLKKAYLLTAYEVLHEKNLEFAIRTLFESAENQVYDIYANRKNSDFSDGERILSEIRELEKSDKIKKRNEDKSRRSWNQFEYYFNSCTRPIVGMYDRERKTFFIINADQIYLNGEEARNQIKLNQITKNSPVLLAFTIVGGVMGSVMGYLAYRDYCVNSIVKDDDVPNIPADNKSVIRNILGNDDSSVLNHPQRGKVDEKILSLSLDTYNRLEGIVDYKKVRIEYRKNKK